MTHRATPGCGAWKIRWPPWKRNCERFERPAGGDVLADLQARGLAFRKDIAAMVEKVTDLEDRLAAARAMAKAAALPGKVGGGETSGPSNRATAPGTNAKTLDELARRISKLEAEGRNLREKANSGAEGIANVIKDAEGRLGRVEQRIARVSRIDNMVLMIERLRRRRSKATIHTCPSFNP